MLSVFSLNYIQIAILALLYKGEKDSSNDFKANKGLKNWKCYLISSTHP